MPRAASRSKGTSGRVSTWWSARSLSTLSPLPSTGPSPRSQGLHSPPPACPPKSESRPRRFTRDSGCGTIYGTARRGRALHLVDRHRSGALRRGLTFSNTRSTMDAHQPCITLREDAAGMKFSRTYSEPGDPYAGLTFEPRTSRIVNPDGKVVFEAKDVQIPAAWSQVATDILAQKYFRKAGVPTASVRVPEDGIPEWLWRSEPASDATFVAETDARQVFHRLAGCWTYWAFKYGYFDDEFQARTYYDEMCAMLARQIGAPNSPQWFNTGLHWAYGIAGPAQGHWFVDPKTAVLGQSTSAYEHPAPHACLPYHALVSTPDGPVPIGEIVSRNLVGLSVYDAAGTTKIVAVKFNGRKPVIRVRLANGNAIEATEDHLVLAQRGDFPSYRWLHAGDLATGWKLVQRQDFALTVSDRVDGLVRERSTLTLKVPTKVELLGTATVAVIGIDRLGEADVYDIETESHTFLTSDVVVHNCFIQSVSDDLVNEGGIMDLWVREARIFKYGSGSGSNFSQIRSAGERLSGGGTSSGLMSL